MKTLRSAQSRAVSDEQKFEAFIAWLTDLVNAGHITIEQIRERLAAMKKMTPEEIRAHAKRLEES